MLPKQLVAYTETIAHDVANTALDGLERGFAIGQAVGKGVLHVISAVEPHFITERRELAQSQIKEFFTIAKEEATRNDR